MEGDGSPLSSLCMVRAAELFPKPPLEKEDEKLKIPLTECNIKQNYYKIKMRSPLILNNIFSGWRISKILREHR